MVTLTKASEQDLPELIAFGKQEFTRTFGHCYTDEDLQNYLQEAYSLEQYQTWYSDHDHYQLWVAKDELKNNQIAAYILCGGCKLPLENCTGGPFDPQQCGEIKRLYVHPDYFGGGVAKQLMEVAMKWLQEKYNNNMIFLGVWSENYRAQKFYEKFGFQKVGEYDFPVGTHIDREFILRLSSC